MIDPTSRDSLSRLKSAIDWSRKKLGKHREESYNAVRQYVGHHYSDDGAKDRVPLNLLEMAVNVYVTQLAAVRPKAMVNAGIPQSRPEAADLELALNQKSEDMDLETTFRLAVVNSMFDLGIVKVGIKPVASVSAQRVFGPGTIEETIWIPDSFADVVDFEDWVHDATAKQFKDCQFMGNRYRVPLSDAKKNPDYDPRVAGELVASTREPFSDGGEPKKAELGRDGGSIGFGLTDEEDIEDFVDLWDIYVPRINSVVTLPCNGDWERPLCVKSVTRNPYHLLWYSDVPNNSMPLAPQAIWFDLADLINRVFCKLGRQAERQKTITVVQAGADADGKRVLAASDGDVISSDNPGSVREIRYGGIDGPSFAFLLQLRDLFSYSAGNLDALGGLAPQAGTLGQDELLQSAASRRMQAMQARVQKFYRGVYDHLAEDLWLNQFYQPRLQKQGPMGITIPTTLSRRGRLSDYRIHVEPYSAVGQSPGAKLAALMQFITQVLAPFGQQLQASGKVIDFNQLVETIGELMGLQDEMSAFIKDVAPPSPEQMASMGQGPLTQGASNPAVSARTYTRVNRPGATQGGKENALIQTLLGSSAQGKELAAVGRMSA